MEEIFLWLFLSTRGGEKRVRIVDLIHKQPINAHQIAKKLGMHYNLVNHHLKLLVEHKIVYKSDLVRYGALYFLTDDFKANYDKFEKILKILEIEE